MRSKGRLFALFTVAALSSSSLLAQTDFTRPALGSAPPAQVIAYEEALRQGEPGLIEFMERFPESVLIPSVIAALAELSSVETAVQTALDAGVPTETVFAVASELSLGLPAAVGLVNNPVLDRAGSDNDDPPSEQDSGQY